MFFLVTSGSTNQVYDQYSHHTKPKLNKIMVHNTTINVVINFCLLTFVVHEWNYGICNVIRKINYQRNNKNASVIGLQITYREHGENAL